MTEPEFRTYFVTTPHHKLPYQVWVELADGSENVDYFDVTGMRHLGFKRPSGNDHHTTLGIFVDEWGWLETIIHQMLQKILDFKSSAMIYPLISSMGNKSLTESISSLVNILTNTPIKNRIEVALKKFSKLNSIRNALVHGVWAVEARPALIAGNVIIDVKLFRYQQPQNIALWSKIYKEKNQKERAKYLYDLKKIKDVTDEVRALSEELSTIMQSEKFNEKIQIVDGPI